MPEQNLPATARPKPARAPGPLADFNGAKPPAPNWFTAALAAVPQRSFPTIEHAQIEALSWGRVGTPGLLLMHGNGAHADWWSFIAPLLAAQGYRVTALSWSGMGGSQWRDAYSQQQYADEAFAVAQATGLFDSPVKPVFVGHSFGGFPLIHAAASAGERLRAAVLVDTPLLSREQRRARRERTGHDGARSRPGAPKKVSATLAEALTRFRLIPEQSCEHPYIVDHIARTSLRAVEGGGYTWRFDPYLWSNFVQTDSEAEIKLARCPLALIWGDRSQLMPAEVVAHIRSLLPADSPAIPIPNADHHLMLDQPLVFVATLHELLADWPRPYQVLVGAGE
jgi:pimeloyl-ACP methyl ester carboxylesterase